MNQTAWTAGLYKTSFDPGQIRHAEKGRDYICVLVDDIDLRGSGLTASGIARDMADSYMRRPSLRDDTLDMLAGVAGNSSGLGSAALTIHKNRFRWIRSGDMCLFHFVDGQMVHASGDGLAPAVGFGAESLSETPLEEGEDSFLLCSASFAKYVRLNEMENALSAADSASEWVRLMKDLYESRIQTEPYCVAAVFCPPKRKSFIRKPVVIVLIAALLLATIFFGMGALRRGKAPGMQSGPGERPGELGGPPQPTPPMQPTRPPQPTYSFIQDADLSAYDL